MNHLMRELAPITDGAWTQIDDEASRSLKHYLAARRLVDFTGPLGWEYSAVDVGRDRVGGRGVPRRRGGRVARSCRWSSCVPRSPSTAAELAAADRGATDLDLDPVIAAGRAAALAEDQLVFHGYTAGGVAGIVTASPHGKVAISDDYGRYPEHVAQAVAVAACGRHRRSLRHRPRCPVLHRRHRDHRARRVPGLRAPPPDPRRPSGLGSGRGRRRRAQPTGR